MKVKVYKAWKDAPVSEFVNIFETFEYFDIT